MHGLILHEPINLNPQAYTQASNWKDTQQQAPTCHQLIDAHLAARLMPVPAHLQQPGQPETLLQGFVREYAQLSCSHVSSCWEWRGCTLLWLCCDFITSDIGHTRCYGLTQLVPVLTSQVAHFTTSMAPRSSLSALARSSVWPSVRRSSLELIRTR